ncbi:hypothetical protein KK083_14145 [Fulvivirgaceae bacterium PWU4]|uniref:DUF4848 domain-containing protein n=1 Tax=Chryseosolibacter histidini TaxID=2782349 RepID=A0AAP2DM62_9BACT|nr:hypothetical protein [Chryseosolibacter histidini]MBT1698029.1 hypothetical protein [Chryseosolibacter histidini]
MKKTSLISEALIGRFKFCAPAKSSTWFFVAFFLFALSCSEDPTKTSPVTENVLPEFVAPDGIDFNGDYLIIPTPQLYEQTMKALKASEPESVSKWTAKLGLTSMRDIYVKAMKEQDDYLLNLLKEYESLPADDKRLKTKPVIPQTPFVAQHAALFDFNEYGAITRLKLSNPLMDRLLNKDGIIMVAGHIFQYNETNTKIIVGGSNSKIAMLPSVAATNDKLNIIVNPVTTQHKTLTDASANGRLAYSYSSSAQINLPDKWDLYFNYSVSLSTSLMPIYDTNNPVCDPPGCGQARASKTQDCYCYYPIIGQQGFTLHYATMECRKIWYSAIDTQHHSDKNRITATITDNVFGTNNYSYTNQYSVNATLYIYDGPIPNNYDVTSGSYTFYEKTFWDEQTFEGQTTHSW